MIEIEKLAQIAIEEAKFKQQEVFNQQKEEEKIQALAAALKATELEEAAANAAQLEAFEKMRLLEIATREKEQMEIERQELEMEAMEKAAAVELAAVLEAEMMYEKTEAIRIEAERKAELVAEEAARKATETLIAAEKQAQA